jgi:hypothetical protein
MTVVEIMSQSFAEMPLWLKIIIPSFIIFFIGNKKSQSLNEISINRRVELMEWNLNHRKKST